MKNLILSKSINLAKGFDYAGFGKVEKSSKDFNFILSLFAVKD